MANPSVESRTYVVTFTSPTDVGGWLANGDYTLTGPAKKKHPLPFGGRQRVLD